MLAREDNVELWWGRKGKRNEFTLHVHFDLASRNDRALLSFVCFHCFTAQKLMHLTPKIRTIIFIN